MQNSEALLVSVSSTETCDPSVAKHVAKHDELFIWSSKKTNAFSCRRGHAYGCKMACLDLYIPAVEL